MSITAEMVKQTTSLTKANRDSTSVRTTVPKEIMEGLNLKIGGILIWELVTEKGKKFARVEKLE